MIKIDLGCGAMRRSGFFRVDIATSLNPDVVCDFDMGFLPFDNDSCHELIVDNVLEHIIDPVKFLNECHRICASNGEIYVRVPYGGSYWAMVDPTHKRVYYPESFLYFTSAAPVLYDHICLWTIRDLKVRRDVGGFSRGLRNLLPGGDRLARFLLGMFDWIEVRMAPVKTI